MKLNQYKEKKNNKKLAFVIVAIIFLIGGVILEKSFANFKVQKSFKVMEGNFIYEGSGDIIFAFYQDDKDVGTMPTKDSGYVFNSQKSSCDNGAKIKWDKNDWGPNIRNLTKTKTKCNLYFVNAGKLRRMAGTLDSEGMWGYKEKITKLVIETVKNKKVAGAGQVVHGPFDESEKKDSSVESYVVCDTGDTNCIGYLQGDKGIELNSDSTGLFYDFTKVSQIEGIENLYTNNVENMDAMFGRMQNLQKLDISSIDTNNVTNMNFMFSGMSSIKELDLSTFDTRNVTDMSYMFSRMSSLQTLTFGENFDTSSVIYMRYMFQYTNSIEELDLSSFNTSNVTDMREMFQGASKLTKITYGPNFIHKSEANTSSMFTNCPANQPNENVHSSWKGVYFY